MAQWLRRASQGREMCCPWSGGHECEPRSGRSWGALYFCPKWYLNQEKERYLMVQWLRRASQGLEMSGLEKFEICISTG